MDKDRLEILLKQLEVDSPPSDFADGIIDMIQDELLSTDGPLSPITVSTKEKAPMYMTDLVMENITPAVKKDAKIISAKEIRYFVNVLILTLLFGWIAAPQEMLLQSDGLWLSIIGYIPGSVLVAFGIGSILWILDYLLRRKITWANK